MACDYCKGKPINKYNRRTKQHQDYPCGFCSDRARQTMSQEDTRPFYPGHVWCQPQSQNFKAK